MNFQELLNSFPWNKRIRFLRLVWGWSQEEAANKCGTTQKVWWGWENGESLPRTNSKKAIASTLGVVVEDIWEPKKEAR